MRERKVLKQQLGVGKAEIAQAAFYEWMSIEVRGVVMRSAF